MKTYKSLIRAFLCFVLTATVFGQSNDHAAGFSTVQTHADAFVPPDHNPSLTSFRASFEIDLEMETGPLLGSCDLSIKEQDSLLMTVQGPFGILIGKLSACTLSLKYFDALTTELIEADPNSEQIRARLPLPLTYNDLIHFMRCEVPYSSASYTLSSVRTEDSTSLFVRTAHPDCIDFVKLSNVDGRVLTYQRKSREGHLLLNINYSHYSSVQGVRFPQRITMNIPQRNTRARFTVTDFVVNPIGEQYTFVVPASVKRTKLD